MDNLKDLTTQQLEDELNKRKASEKDVRWWDLVLLAFIIVGIPLMAGLFTYFILFAGFSNSDIRIVVSIMAFAVTEVVILWVFGGR